MASKKLTISLATALTALVFPFAVHAQLGNLGGLMGGSKGGGVSADQVEKDLREYFSGVNRTNRLLGEALKLNELVQSAQEKAECTQSGSCGLKDGSSLIKGHSETVVKKVKEMQAAGTKMTEEESVKFTRSFEGLGKAAVFAKKIISDGKNMDKGVKALTIAGSIPDVATSMKATFDAAGAVISYMRFSGVKPDDLIKSVTAAASESGIPMPDGFGK